MADHELRLQRLTAADVQPLRTRILRPGQRELCEYEVDRLDETLHFGLVDDAGAARAVVTIFPQVCPAFAETPALRFRGLCVAERLRGQGLGRRLLEGAIAPAAVASLSAKLIWCNARTSAAEFYRACGFEATGEVFEVPGIGPHIIMWKPLPAVLA